MVTPERHRLCKKLLKGPSDVEALDALRRFHRQTLYDLPIGVCSLGRDLEILSWNRALMEMTSICDSLVLDSLI